MLCTEAVSPREPVITLPNLLTLVRIPLAAVIWLAPDNAAFVLAVVAVAGATDVFDGRVARALRRRELRRGGDPRRLGKADAIGAWLDPLCDKLFVVSVLAAVWYGFEPPLVALVLATTRELALMPLYVAYRLHRSVQSYVRLDFRAGWPGKLTTVMQFVVIGAVLLVPAWVMNAAIVTAVIGVFAAVSYAHRAVRWARFASHNDFLIPTLKERYPR